MNKKNQKKYIIQLFIFLLLVVVQLKLQAKSYSKNNDIILNEKIRENERSFSNENLSYQTQTAPSDSLSDSSLGVKEDTRLSEIVVVGYGSQAKKELTGSVAVVGEEAVKALNPVRVEQALQGQVAGVQISPSSGSPGGGSNIRIRGVSTNGDNRPLILLDGNVIEELNVINPSEIASISILKDASAAIYGARAANGVILITSKTGKPRTPVSVSYGNFGGWQSASRTIEVLNSREYAAIINETYIANGENPPFKDIDNIPINTDWQDKVLQNSHIFQQNLNVSKGWKTTTMSLTGSHISQDGIVGGPKASFRRYTGRANVNSTFFKKLKLETATSYMFIKRRELSENVLGSPLFNALNMAPTFDVYDSAGKFTLPETGFGSEIVNPIQQIENSHNISYTNKFSGSYRLSYSFLKYFNVQARYQYNYAIVNSSQFYPSVYYGNNKIFNLTDSTDRYIQRDEGFYDHTIDALATFDKVFANDHHVKVLLGASTFMTRKIEDVQYIGNDLPNNTTFEEALIGNADTVIINNIPLWESRLLSYFGRLQYDYKKRYYLSAILRRDGSSNFGPRNRFGLFPSISLGWVMTNENFIENSSINDILTFFKIRGSYGVIGNDRIGNNAYRSVINNLNVGRYGFGKNVISQGTAVGRLPNPSIKWEEQTTWDIGLDIELFNKMFSITADYYYKRTKDLLASPQVSGILGSTAPGSGAPVVNAGTVDNYGMEFSIEYYKEFRPDASFKVSYNFTSINNKVISINDEKGFLSGGGFGVGQDPPSRMEAGFPIGYFYGYKTNGVFQSQEEVNDHATQKYARPGELRFVDLNNDGEITVDDKTMIGSPIPDFIMGMNLSGNYKGFDIQVYLNATFGNEIIRNYERTQPLVNRGKYVLNRWTNKGSSTDYPYVTKGLTSITDLSDYFVEDGSFVRIQTVQIGYEFSQKWLEKVFTKSLRVFASVNNLYTITKYRGYDPAFTSGAPIGGGIDGGFYPAARTFLFGLNINF